MANTAIENLSERNADLNLELETLEEELIFARRNVKILENKCDGIVVQMLNKATGMLDKVTSWYIIHDVIY